MIKRLTRQSHYDSINILAGQERLQALFTIEHLGLDLMLLLCTLLKLRRRSLRPRPVRNQLQAIRELGNSRQMS